MDAITVINSESSQIILNKFYNSANRKVHLENALQIFKNCTDLSSVHSLISIGTYVYCCVLLSGVFICLSFSDNTLDLSASAAMSTVIFALSAVDDQLNANNLKENKDLLLMLFEKVFVAGVPVTFNQNVIASLLEGKDFTDKFGEKVLGTIAEYPVNTLRNFLDNINDNQNDYSSKGPYLDNKVFIDFIDTFSGSLDKNGANPNRTVKTSILVKSKCCEKREITILLDLPFKVEYLTVGPTVKTKRKSIITSKNVVFEAINGEYYILDMLPILPTVFLPFKITTKVEHRNGKMIVMFELSPTEVKGELFNLNGVELTLKLNKELDVKVISVSKGDYEDKVGEVRFNVGKVTTEEKVNGSVEIEVKEQEAVEKFILLLNCNVDNFLINGGRIGKCSYKNGKGVEVAGRISTRFENVELVI